MTYPGSSTPQPDDRRAARGGRGPLWALLAVAVVCLLGAVSLLVVRVSRHSGDDATAGAPAGSMASSAASGATGTARAGTSSTSPTSEDNRPPVPTSAIDRLLPDKSTVASAMDAPDIGLVNHGDAMGSKHLVDRDCESIEMLAQDTDFAGSGWTAQRWQWWISPPDEHAAQYSRMVRFAAVMYPQASTATAFYQKQVPVWRACSGRTVNIRFADEPNDQDNFSSLGEVTESANMLTVIATEEGGGGWSCRESATVHNNIYLRLSACDRRGATQTTGQPILDAVTAQIDAVG